MMFIHFSKLFCLVVMLLCSFVILGCFDSSFSALHCYSWVAMASAKHTTISSINRTKSMSFDDLFLLLKSSPVLFSFLLWVFLPSLLCLNCLLTPKLVFCKTMNIIAVVSFSFIQYAHVQRYVCVCVTVSCYSATIGILTMVVFDAIQALVFIVILSMYVCICILNWLL